MYKTIRAAIIIFLLIPLFLSLSQASDSEYEVIYPIVDPVFVAPRLEEPTDTIPAKPMAEHPSDTIAAQELDMPLEASDVIPAEPVVVPYRSRGDYLIAPPFRNLEAEKRAYYPAQNRDYYPAQKRAYYPMTDREYYPAQKRESYPAQERDSY